MAENSHGHHDVPWTRLVVVDYYSKYPEVSLLPDETASSIITYTKSICARHGIPEYIGGDDMPFGSREFNDFAYEWGIKTATPCLTYACTKTSVHRALQLLNHGDVVRVQRGNVWEPAVVTGPHIQPRSYLVQNQHGTTAT